ncbi:uncharacterized protein LOC142556982 isoform X5 [Dermacentor variabilis]|uniref:uncharacterized protein LOC142556982 isoform X5 n=1 Tax=Dermacentor variabilis TaxID=34621 RepID=UPI003F5BEF44
MQMLRQGAWSSAFVKSWRSASDTIPRVLRHWAAVQAWRLVGEDVQRHGLHHGQATLLTAASCASSTARCRFLTVSTHSPCTPWMC